MFNSDKCCQISVCFVFHAYKQNIMRVVMYNICEFVLCLSLYFIMRLLLFIYSRKVKYPCFISYYYFYLLSFYYHILYSDNKSDIDVFQVTFYAIHFLKEKILIILVYTFNIL